MNHRCAIVQSNSHAGRLWGVSRALRQGTMRGLHGACCEQVASCMAHGGLAGRMLSGMLQRDAVFTGCKVAIRIVASKLGSAHLSKRLSRPAALSADHVAA
jgi:hypothetical protein